MKISVKSKGNFNNTENFFKKNKNYDLAWKLNKYGLLGASLLAAATPMDSGKTAESWNYEIKKSQNGLKLIFTNSNENQGIPIAILIQYGHGTRNGGYVQGRDFINPVVRPLFDEIAKNVWEEVTKG